MALDRQSAHRVTAGLSPAEGRSWRSERWTGQRRNGRTKKGDHGIQVSVFSYGVGVRGGLSSGCVREESEGERAEGEAGASPTQSRADQCVRAFPPCHMERFPPLTNDQALGAAPKKKKKKEEASQVVTVSGLERPPGGARTNQ